ncbi:MAG: hypothetical protein AMQ74_01461 [Candidatus Methanofastidiosum methylothiophilum]|uniref:Uncharacterized protein n=1 Tax=Candidatus Methanofastidiosum methylothiophilum TaxID=1705564 RepID=A0A150IW65_9EURY|nr:MAG: hypothetical protein AMQ74_01461 [Candidatus Methanofastidiosum methylthiophilus]
MSERPGLTSKRDLVLMSIPSISPSKLTRSPIVPRKAFAVSIERAFNTIITLSNPSSSEIAFDGLLKISSTPSILLSKRDVIPIVPTMYDFKIYFSLRF